MHTKWYNVSYCWCVFNSSKTCQSWLSGIGRLCIRYCCFYIGICPMSGAYFKPWYLSTVLPKIITEIVFFIEICNKFVVMNNRQNARNFLSFNIVFSNDQQYFGGLIFLIFFCSTCFCSSPGFHVSNFAAFQVWLLICYFYFSSKVDKPYFFLNHRFHFVIYSRLLIVKNFGFMGNEIFHNIKNGFIKNLYLCICTLVRKSSFPVELGYEPLH